MILELVEREHLEVQVADALGHQVVGDGEDAVNQQLPAGGLPEELIGHDVIDDAFVVELLEVVKDDHAQLVELF